MTDATWTKMSSSKRTVTEKDEAGKPKKNRDGSLLTVDTIVTVYHGKWLYRTVTEEIRNLGNNEEGEAVTRTSLSTKLSIIPRVRETHEKESRSKRVKRNIEELAAEAGISRDDARGRLRAGNPLEGGA